MALRRASVTVLLLLGKRQELDLAATEVFVLVVVETLQVLGYTPGPHPHPDLHTGAGHIHIHPSVWMHLPAHPSIHHSSIGLSSIFPS